MNSDYRNLLEETINKLNKCGKIPNDVQWVGNAKSWTTWDDFINYGSVQYDSGYGGAEIDCELVVVGNDWWLERQEYDGSEWWEFKTIPIKPKNETKYINVMNVWEYD